MKVLKFGGTSVGTVESLVNVRNIVDSLSEPAIVVVSALGGLTDMLISTARRASESKCAHQSAMASISRRHHDIIDAMVPSERAGETHRRVQSLLDDLNDVFTGISLIKSLPERVLDIVVSFGERMSSVIVASMLKNAGHHESLDFIRTERWFNKDIADGTLTEELIRKEFGTPMDRHAVLGGFISRDRDTGEITNLGRGGSDYTAALIAGTLGAECLEIWTDVDGFMTSDPRIIKNASVIPAMTFIESMELCNYGAKVIYPPTIYPVFHRNIPIKILNTFNASAPGTHISDCCANPGRVIGATSMNAVTLIAVTAACESGAEGLDTRAYNALSRNGVGILLTGRRDNPLEFRLAVKDADVAKAESLLKSEFAPELQRGEVTGVRTAGDLSIVAAVGESIRKLSGLGARLENTLQRNGISVRAVSDSSETTVAVVVGSDDSKEALRLVHDSSVSAVAR